MEYVFAIQEPSQSLAILCIERALPLRDETLDGKRVAIVECTAADVPVLLATIVGLAVRFGAAGTRAA